MEYEETDGFYLSSLILKFSLIYNKLGMFRASYSLTTPTGATYNTIVGSSKVYLSSLVNIPLLIKAMGLE